MGNCKSTPITVQLRKIYDKSDELNKLKINKASLEEIYIKIDELNKIINEMDHIILSDCVHIDLMNRF